MLNSTGLATRTSECRIVYGTYTQLLIQLDILQQTASEFRSSGFVNSFID